MPLDLTPNRIDRMAMALRAYAHSRGASEQEDDQEAAVRAAHRIVAILERTPA